jgi:GntR family transcriptional regulator, negative regulator for fad regulon and positive regulator of fabA
MNNWHAPQRPNDYAEHALVQAILDGRYPPGSPLPAERALAVQLGVTRPTLREALQRLARDGWLTVQQGKSTTVNDFWRDGGLNVLGTLVHYPEHLPPGFVGHLLAVRLDLAPAYTRTAVAQAAAEVAAYVGGYAGLAEETAVYATFDWQLHRHLTQQSGNPIYGLILNGFADFYQQLAAQYFQSQAARAHSHAFYAALHAAALSQDPAQAEQITRQAMAESIQLWKSRLPVASGR